MKAKFSKSLVHIYGIESQEAFHEFHVSNTASLLHFVCSLCMGIVGTLAALLAQNRSRLEATDPVQLSGFTELCMLGPPCSGPSTPHEVGGERRKIRKAWRNPQQAYGRDFRLVGPSKISDHSCNLTTFCCIRPFNHFTLRPFKVLFLWVGSWWHNSQMLDSYSFTTKMINQSCTMCYVLFRVLVVCRLPLLLSASNITSAKATWPAPAAGMPRDIKGGPFSYLIQPAAAT